MYIYGFVKEGNSYSRKLFRITYPAPLDFKPTRKQIKKIVNLIDYIELYRPKNGVKWYTISKKEFDERVGILNQYWGMNLPTKTGTYLYSKKVNKWLASTEYDGLIATAIDIDFNQLEAITSGSSGAGTQLSIWDYITAFFVGLGKKLGNIFGVFFNPTKWEEMVNDFFNHIGGQTQFFNLDLDSLRDGSFFNSLSVPDLFTSGSGINNNNITNRISTLTTDIANKATEIANKTAEILGLQNNNQLLSEANEALNRYNETINNSLSTLYNFVSSNLSSVWQGLLDFLKSLFDWDFNNN